MPFDPAELPHPDDKNAQHTDAGLKTGWPEVQPAQDGLRAGLPDIPVPSAAVEDSRPWYRTLTGYQWFVFLVCCLAWDMDCMDQQLFNLARRPAMAELVAKVQPVDSRIADLKKQLEAKATEPVTDTQVLAALQNADIGA